MNSEEVIEHIKILIPIHSIEKKFCLAIVLLICFGVVSSVMFKDWGLFERSGSLVVIAGVALAWRDLTGKIDWAKEYAIDEFDKTILALQSEGGLIKRAMNMPKIEELNGQSAEIQKQLAAAKIRARSYEALALIIGTLIWGYGSYLSLLVSKIT